MASDDEIDNRFNACFKLHLLTSFIVNSLHYTSLVGGVNSVLHIKHGLAKTAKETGAEVIHGPLRYPSETGSWQLGDTALYRPVQCVDLGEHLWQYHDHKVTLTLAVTGEAEPERFVCGICEFVMDELGDCPRCRLLNKAIAGAVKA
jgi:hypothetical protein